MKFLVFNAFRILTYIEQCNYVQSTNIILEKLNHFQILIHLAATQ